VILSIIPLTLIACAKQVPDSNVTDAYNFPVKPGTEAWQALTTHDKMTKACQIPESILQKMSTAGLVETVLNYPLLGDMKAYNSIQQGFDAVAVQFNGLPELLNRKDAGTELLARYRTVEPAAIKDDWTLLQKGLYAASIENIEILLAQDVILDNLTETQCQDLIKEATAKYQAKQKYGQIYGQSGQESTARLIGKGLLQVSYVPFEQKVQEDITLQNFLSTGSFANESTLSEIYSQAEQFLAGR
jgi:hypothetical protein